MGSGASRTRKRQVITTSFNKARGRSTVRETPKPEDDRLHNVHVRDIDYDHKKRQSQEEIEHASEWADERGIHRAIKDGL